MNKKPAIILAALLVALTGSTASADTLTPEQRSLFRQGIIFFNPSGGSNCYAVSVAGAANNPSGVNLTGSDNSEKIINALSVAGYTPTAIAAILGNLHGESSDLDPTAEYKNISYGIAQWEGDRRTNLEKHAASLGLPVSSLEAQVSFLVSELPDRNSALSTGALNKMSFEEATWYVYRYFETPASSFRTKDRYPDVNNEITPTFGNLNPTTTAAAYSAYNNRLSYAKRYLGIDPSDTTNTPSASAPIFSSVNSCPPGYSSRYASTGPSVIDSSGSSVGADGFTVYLQTDPRWASFRYGSGGINGNAGSTIGDAGCGPSTFAMAATALLGRAITPAETSDIAGKAGMYIPGSGSSHSVIPLLARHYGLSAATVSHSGSDASVISAINSALAAGKLVTSSGRGGKPYTSGGHFVLIRGVTADGKWLIANSGTRFDQDKKWEPAEVLSAGLNISNLYALGN